MTKATTKKARRAARKLFPKAKHNTRAFTPQDHAALPNDPDRKPTK